MNVAPDERPIVLWLVVCFLMVVAMIAIGAITRLTESGLSMVEWRPLIGALPPVGEAEWRRLFDLYRQTSEYRLENPGMGLAEFKTIFWWEYVHRLWGRLIGLAFGLPLAWFLIRRRVPQGMAPHLILLFVLGAMQGVIGWWMVKSGFVDRHDVSQYRLTIHLALALLILGYMEWLVLGMSGRGARRAAPAGLRRLALATLAAAALTALSGGLVAGLGAGMDYNTWPLMAGELVPAGLFDASPWWLGAFESPLTAQFDHRVLAYATAAMVIWFWLSARRAGIGGGGRRAANALLLMVALQILLGISNLLLVVPIPLAVLHQLGAVALFCLALWAVHVLRARS
ncbi:MAG: COX15/CtaA family protein [Alphaproteobacteria bacterium]|jgi:cytochrome c oxidase assembly protein subunit 15|nr:COX15/CtaA family protein [Alphaproteobacteria bacterium]